MSRRVNLKIETPPKSNKRATTSSSLPARPPKQARPNEAPEQNDDSGEKLFKTAKGLLHLTPNSEIKLLKGGDGSDFAIECSGGRFMVHRLILQGISAVLNTKLHDLSNVYRTFSKSRASIAIILWYIYTGGKLPASDEMVDPEPWLQFSNTDAYCEALIEADNVASEWDLDKIRWPIHYWVSQYLKRRWRGEYRSIAERNNAEKLFENVLKVISGPAHGSQGSKRLSSLIVWIVVFQNASEEGSEYLIDDHMLKRYIRRDGVFAVSLYEEQTFVTKELATCAGCKKTSRYPESARLLDVTFGDRKESLTCICGFRGFCGKKCNAEHPKLCLKAASCAECSPEEAEAAASSLWGQYCVFDERLKQIVFKQKAA